jgi:predicted kinase
MPQIYFDSTPQPPAYIFDAARLCQEIPALRDLDNCPQSPVHHAEGDVGIHTRMVCEWLVNSPEWRNLDETGRRVTFWAALLHDIAKPATTRAEDDGRITSPGHSRRGEIMARGLLWELHAPFAEREEIVNLIAFHQFPFFLIEREDAQRKLYEISQTARCDYLALVARADAGGRICQDQRRLFDNIELFLEMARLENCLDAPRSFASDHSRFLYFRHSDRDADYQAFDDTICEVILLSGLPGAGKSTWAANNPAVGPQVCLDDIRRELGVKPTDNQGVVMQTARERARQFLRRKEPFVWNATNLSLLHRQQNIALFAAYNARVRIVYIETSPALLFSQNANREAAAPISVIKKMIERWEMPKITEAHRLDCVISN